MSYDSWRNYVDGYISIEGDGVVAYSRGNGDPRHFYGLVNGGAGGRITNAYWGEHAGCDVIVVETNYGSTLYAGENGTGIF